MTELIDWTGKAYEKFPKTEELHEHLRDYLITIGEDPDKKTMGLTLAESLMPFYIQYALSRYYVEEGLDEDKLKQHFIESVRYDKEYWSKYSKKKIEEE